MPQAVERNYAMPEEVETLYQNRHECPECGTKWTNEQDCVSNDCCPKCCTEAEPYDSVAL